jgi:K+-transporting ATPase A subunit
MKQNMGSADRIIRLLAVVVIGYLYATGVISGTLAIILGIVAVAFVLTSLIGWCPLYLPLKISTKKAEKAA